MYIKKSQFFFLNNLKEFFFKIGQVIKIFYIVKYKNKKRIYSFIGLCQFKNNNKFYLYNKLKKEKIFFIFSMLSPSILKIFLIKMYKQFIYRVSKIYFKINLFLKDDTMIRNYIISTFDSYTYKFENFIVSTVFNKKRKKLIKGRYKYREIWKKTS